MPNGEVEEPPRRGPRDHLPFTGPSNDCYAEPARDMSAMTIESPTMNPMYEPVTFSACSLVSLSQNINPAIDTAEATRQASTSPSKVGFRLLMTLSTTVTTRETTKTFPRAEDSAPSENRETKI